MSVVSSHLTSPPHHPYHRVAHNLTEILFGKRMSLWPDGQPIASSRRPKDG